jgi:uncharacterized protein YndB with AHSA1/START domain
MPGQTTAIDQTERIFEVFIKTSPERLWEAITDPEIRAKYNFGAGLYGDWSVGSRQQMTAPDAGFTLGECEILEIDPPRRLVHTLEAFFSEAARSEPTSRVTWEISTVGNDSCRLVVTHDQLRVGGTDEIWGGWPMILSGLKTWLETGELLTTPGSLLYVQG